MLSIENPVSITKISIQWQYRNLQMLSVQLVFQLLSWICSLESQSLKQQQQQKKAGDVPAFCLFLSFCYRSQRVHLKILQICWHAIMGNYKVLVKCRKLFYFSLSNVTDITLQASGRCFFLNHLDHRYWGVGWRGRLLRWIASLPHLSHIIYVTGLQAGKSAGETGSV